MSDPSGVAVPDSAHPTLWRRTVADPADWFDTDDIAEARRYARPKRRVEVAQTVVTVVALAIVVATRLGPEVAERTGSHWTVQVVAVVALTALVELLYAPAFAWWNEMVHDRRWEISTQTPRGFAADVAKGVAVQIVVLSALLIPVLAVIRAVDWWWIGAWAVLFALQAFLAFVYPVWIMPVFNTFTRLEPGDELHDRIRAVAARTGTSLEGVYTMDASRRSRRDNAFVAGFGATKRVVVFDTMLEHPPEVIEQVVAHEIGHYRRKHLAVMLPVIGVSSLAAFVTLWAASEWTWLLDAAGIDGFGDPGAVPLVMLLFGAVLSATKVVTSLVSRAHEREADLEALEVLGDADTFCEVWRRMAPKNRVDLDPPAWKRLTRTHPEVPERMEFARRWAQLNGVAAPSTG